MPYNRFVVTSATQVPDENAPQTFLDIMYQVRKAASIERGAQTFDLFLEQAQRSTIPDYAQDAINEAISLVLPEATASLAAGVLPAEYYGEIAQRLFGFPPTISEAEAQHAVNYALAVASAKQYLQIAGETQATTEKLLNVREQTLAELSRAFHCSPDDVLQILKERYPDASIIEYLESALTQAELTKQTSAALRESPLTHYGNMLIHEDQETVAYRKGPSAVAVKTIRQMTGASIPKRFRRIENYLETYFQDRDHQNRLFMQSRPQKR